MTYKLSLEQKARKKEYERLRYLANKEVMLARQKQYYEDNKEARLDYGKQYYAENKEQALETRKNWRTANPERFKALVAEWGRSNPIGRKAIKHNYHAKKREAGGTHTKDDLTAIWVEQNGICAAPHCTTELTESCSLDHKYPVSRGGSNSPENLQFLCKSCNSQKHAKTMEEWLNARRA